MGDQNARGATYLSTVSGSLAQNPSAPSRSWHYCFRDFCSYSFSHMAVLRCQLSGFLRKPGPDISLPFFSDLNPPQTSVNGALTNFSSVKPRLSMYCISLKQDVPVLRDKWTFYIKTILHFVQSDIPHLSKPSLWYQWRHTPICIITEFIIINRDKNQKSYDRR